MLGQRLTQDTSDITGEGDGINRYCQQSNFQRRDQTPRRRTHYARKNFKSNEAPSRQCKIWPAPAPTADNCRKFCTILLPRSGDKRATMGIRYRINT